RELEAHLLAFRQWDGGKRAQDRAAFADRARDQVLRQRRSHLRADRYGTGRFARDRHTLRVAAEGRDVLLHPLERRMLIEQGVIAGGALRRLLRQLGVREEAEHAQAIIYGDRHNSLLRHAFAVVAPLRTVARQKTASEEIDQDRQPLIA